MMELIRPDDDGTPVHDQTGHINAGDLADAAATLEARIGCDSRLYTADGTPMFTSDHHNPYHVGDGYYRVTKGGQHGYEYVRITTEEARHVTTLERLVIARNDRTADWLFRDKLPVGRNEV